MKIFVSLIFLFFCGFGYGQQLTYKPINPAFGGDTFNYQWMLSSANAQNSFEDPDDPDRGQGSELDRFAENLNRQLLNQLSRSLFTAQFGDGIQEGTFTFGSLSLEVYQSAQGLVINILDTNTGEQTQIIVPN